MNPLAHVQVSVQIVDCQQGAKGTEKNPVHGELILKLLWGVDKALGSESANGIYST